jgi:ATP-binding cassette subfamily B protein
MTINIKNITGALRIIWESSPVWSLVNVIFSVVRGVLPLALIYIVKLVIDDVIRIAASGKPLLTDPEILNTFIIAGVFFLLNALIGAANSYVREKQSYIVIDHIQNIIHEKTIAIPYRYFEDSEYQNVFYRAVEESSYRPSRVFYGLLGLLQNSVTLILIIAVLMTLGWKVILFLLMISVPIVFFNLHYSKLFYFLKKEQTEEERKVGYYNRLMTSKDFAKELRIFDLGNYFKGKYENLRSDLRQKQLHIIRRRTLWEILVQVISTVFLLMIFGYIIYSTVTKKISTGDMAMYFLALHRGYNVLQEWLSRISALYEDNLFLKNFFEFLKIKVNADRTSGSHFPKPIKKGVSFKDVSFKYPNTKRWVLKDVNFSIDAGETVAIVGTNGAGKTTLVKMLAGLYKPVSGQITVDGVNWSGIKSDELADAVSVIFQDFMLYNVNAKKNIWFGNIKRRPDDGPVQEAARNAGIHELFMKLPHGYDTVLGTLFKNSEQLSRGEWQRTALARSFFNDAQLIILDEPTSSLDAFTEAGLLEHFREIASGRTAIIISHRLTTIKLADRIVVLDGSTVAETGTHEDLMKKGGVYKKMIEALDQ